MEAHERIARNVKAFAAFEDITLATVYGTLGMSRQVWNDRTTGKSAFKFTEVEKLAELLAVTTDELTSDPSMLVARIRERSPAGMGSGRADANSVWATPDDGFVQVCLDDLFVEAA